MNKGQLIEAIMAKTGYSRKVAAEHLDAILDEIMHQVANGEKVTITGFGAFEPVPYAARTGRNPQTGEPVEIPEGITPKFRAGALFKAAVNS